MKSEASMTYTRRAIAVSRHVVIALFMAILTGSFTEGQADQWRPGEGASLVAPSRSGFVTSMHANYKLDSLRSATWQFDRKPLLRIGEADGDEPYVFADVRTAFRMRDRIVIADGRLATIRLYDEKGRATKSIGGRGRGPGQFMMLWTVIPYHNTILAADRLLNRISQFGLDGKLMTTLPVNVVGGGDLDVLGDLGNDSALIRVGTRPGRVPLLLRSQRTLSRDTGILAVLSIQTGRWREFGRFKDMETVVTGGLGRMNIRRAPFGRCDYVAVGRERIYIGDSSKDTILVFGRTGRRISAIKLNLLQRPVPAHGVRKYYEATKGPRAAASYLQAIQFPLVTPQAMPTFDGLLVDSEDNLWVRVYAPPWNRAETSWLVFNPLGRPIGIVKGVSPRTNIPFEPDLLYVTADHGLVLMQDSLDVLFVQKHRLTKIH